MSNTMFDAGRDAIERAARRLENQPCAGTLRRHDGSVRTCGYPMSDAIHGTVAVCGELRGSPCAGPAEHHEFVVPTHVHFHEHSGSRHAHRHAHLAPADPVPVWGRDRHPHSHLDALR